MTWRYTHLVDEATAIQPLVRLYLKSKKPEDANLLRAEKPRVWCASTWCGRGFSGEGAFPHHRLKHTVDGVDCPDCLAEKRGVKPSDPEVERPNLRMEAEGRTKNN